MQEDVQLFTYTAGTYKEAMDAAKNAHGEDALVVTSRELKKKSILEKGLYEIVVCAPKSASADKAEDKPSIDTIIGDEEENKMPSNSIQKRLEQISQKQNERKKAMINEMKNDEYLDISQAVKEIAKIAKAPKNEPQKEEDLEKPAYKKPTITNAIEPKNAESKPNIDNLKELSSIRQELDKLNDKMKMMQNMFWSDSNNQAPNIPYEFAEIYRICKNSGMNTEHLDDIMQLSQQLMPLNMRENSATIKRYFREVLRKMIVCRPENIDSKRKRIVMLVGPTGVGKTTTIAKLAAHYSLYHRYKVGLITLDSYRIGAFDQLAFYAKKLKLSISAVEDTGEFTKAIEELKYCDYVLIDTVGSSQHDKQKLDILKKYVNTDYNIDVSLVMCATTKYEDLKDIYDSFSVLDIDTLIFSKLDESNGFGNVFSLIYDTKKPVSYLSIGQEVPDDILVAKNDYLADCIINGFQKPAKDEL